MKNLPVFLLVAAFGMAAPAGAGQEPAARTSSDRGFLTEAASGSMMEVELGRVAENHAQSDRVKQFGKRMVDDHSKALDEIKRLGAQKNIPVPSGMTEKHREEVARLSKLRGAEFDRAYMDMMVQDHEEDVAKFREEAKSAEDPDVKALASKLLPTLESHLDMSKQVYASVGGNQPRALR